MSRPPGNAPRGFAARLAALTIDSRLTPLAVIASLLLGILAVVQLPREEEPQIKVPMVDVVTLMPGATAIEVENQLSRPVEKLLWEIPGVEYVYSTSSPGSSLVVVRFKVGSDLDQCLVRLNQKLQSNPGLFTAGAEQPLIKPRTIDDVPVVALTLHSRTQEQATLRRLAAQLDDAVKALPDVAETTLIGGSRRQLRVLVDPVQLAARELTLDDVTASLRSANARSQDGALAVANREVMIESGTYLRDAADAMHLVLGVSQGRPIFLRDVAAVEDGVAEPADYVLFGGGGADSAEEAAVTLSIAKRPGANAVAVVAAVRRTVDRLAGRLWPRDVAIAFTRDYGATASEKSNELLLHMGIAVFGVALLILGFLGGRESLVVLLAIPVTLGLTLLVFYLYGYTLNRITLFALIFSIGILVDDAIVVVENIVRHQRLAREGAGNLRAVAIAAVGEVGNPTLLATWAVIAAVLPMDFVGGLMGPYMRPIPVGASAAMLFSLLVAFTVTPWAALRVLRRRLSATGAGHDGGAGSGALPDFFTRLYHRVMRPLIAEPRWRWGFLGVVGLLLAGAVALVPLGVVQIKMLPFDNKAEFQLILNMPEGTTLEQTTRVARELAAAVRQEPEVQDYQIYAGTASPFNFNGLVRHYFQRRGANVADVQVNLCPKEERKAQSHEVAVRVRPRLAAIAAKYGGALAVAEVPPGPPVLQTLVAEIYAPTADARLALARAVREIFDRTEGVVDVDWYVEDQPPSVQVHADRLKAESHGVSGETITRTVRTATSGLVADRFHLPEERERGDIRVELPRARRGVPADLLALQVRSRGEAAAGRVGRLVSLGELVSLEPAVRERNLYRKNLQPVIYVTGDVADRVASPAYALFAMKRELAKIDGRKFGGTQKSVELYHLHQPESELEPAIKWDGEWHVTLEVFRDLGLAFAVVCGLIAMLMVGWFKSYLTPLVIMVVIPLSLIGILPAHALAGAFFTATSMIGFMAGAGIIVRNSIILVDFIELRRAQGRPLAEAVLEAGAVRFRPMLLTALAVIIGASVILADPIFQGLALSLLAGEIASLLVSRFAVPVLYFMINRTGPHPVEVSPPTGGSSDNFPET